MKIKSTKLFDYFTKGHERTIRAKKNIILLFILKGFSIIISLALVPLTINYLDTTKYGIWITLSSIVGWFGIFDIGLGHGLRNKLAEALANGETKLARVYISTTYAILSIFVAAILLLFYSLSAFLNWGFILNVGDDAVLNSDLSILALVVFTFFCIHFIFKLLTTVLTADQKPALASSFDVVGKAFALIIIYILTKTTDGSLLYVGLVKSGAPLLVLMIASRWFYSGKYSVYKPSLKDIDFGQAPFLFILGVKFFVIQISVILLYQTNNIIISHLFGPEQVSPYSVAYTYFSVLIMGLTIILHPLWSAFTEAWIKNDFCWIKTVMHQLLLVWGLLTVIALAMVIGSKWVYKIWVGDIVEVPLSMSVLIAAWVLLISWSSIFSYFVNGISKIQLQLYLGVIAALVNVPLAIYLGSIIGIEGVFIANILVILPIVFILPIQYSKLLNNRAEGIWNK